jgi:hypothetical protein
MLSTRGSEEGSKRTKLRAINNLLLEQTISPHLETYSRSTVEIFYLAVLSQLFNLDKHPTCLISWLGDISLKDLSSLE